ncbi:unnamed protein product [Trifolium pratense]|uniref:Uncharacterized protein n=1 Tax=Trifolium pratense TaxID=57577 RepID=A0ACB0K6F8_TRIPR|nr:unnamed protein product [Trifolium pratense]
MTADPELVSAFNAKNAISKVNSVSEEVSIGKVVEVDVEGDESNVEYVAQDLMDKFTDQGVDTGTDTIDLTTDIHDVETTKRDFSFVASTSDGPNMEPEMAKLHESMLLKLTQEQRSVYNQIMDSVSTGAGGFFFLYGYGGTGKTFLWNTLSAAIRSKGSIVLNAASSGIAALLLPGGRTAHSTFALPFLLNEQSTCGIKWKSVRAELLRKTKLIIWDEAPMMHRFCFEAFDRTMRDIMSSVNPEANTKPFGGMTVVLGGDFRQILPVVRKGSRQDIISSAVNSSDLWSYCRVLRLTKNMRLGSSTIQSEEEEIKNFADWILSIGNGETGPDENGQYVIDIPQDLLIQDCHDPLMSLVNFTYPDLLSNMKNPSYFQDRGILAPTLESVEHVNDYLMSIIPGTEREYLSCDSVCQSDSNSEIQPDWFTPEFLNDIKCSGIPNHRLKLKVGCPAMLMRNIDQAAGL